MTTTLTLVTEPARSVVAPRRPRSFWRKPWWWPTRYRMATRHALQKRVDQLEAALTVISVALGPAVPGGAA